MSFLNRVITKDVKIVPTAAMSGARHFSVRAGGIPWPNTDATHSHAQLGFPYKSHAIKEFAVCLMLLNL